jgi:hypothetical protein
MEKSIKGILVDPFLKTVTEVTVTGLKEEWGMNYLDSLYRHLGCKTIEAAYLNIEDESLYVDEEGMYPGRQMFFYLPKLSPYQPLAGRGIFVGLDETTGDSSDTKMKVEDILGQIEWLDRVQALQKSQSIEAQL